jgi:hypothetical protein
MPLVILHHLLNVSVQLAYKRGLKKICIWEQAVVYRQHKPRGFYTVSKLIGTETTGRTAGLLMTEGGWLSQDATHRQASRP